MYKHRRLLRIIFTQKDMFSHEVYAFRSLISSVLKVNIIVIVELEVISVRDATSVRKNGDH